MSPLPRHRVNLLPDQTNRDNVSLLDIDLASFLTVHLYDWESSLAQGYSALMYAHCVYSVHLGHSIWPPWDLGIWATNANMKLILPGILSKSLLDQGISYFLPASMRLGGYTVACKYVNLIPFTGFNIHIYSSLIQEK